MSQNPFKPSENQMNAQYVRSAQNGNCGQSHGTLETYITRNHVSVVTLGATPAKRERVGL
jgi:hypothetical protein